MRATWARSIIDLAIFSCAVVATYLAQTTDRPRTAVLVLLTGVIVVAFRSGFANGLAAAISASLIYNFFLSEPAFGFGITSADEALPLVAFNVSAVLAAIMVGRLRDSEKKANEAQAETAFLLSVSDGLQSAIKPEEVEKAIAGIIPPRDVTSIEIFLAQGKLFWRPSTGDVELDPVATLIRHHDIAGAHKPKPVIIELIGASGLLGIVKFHRNHAPLDQRGYTQLQSIATMLALAVERCLLLEELAEARARMRSEALKDALLSSVSHDLRTPVTVIQAAAGALRSSAVKLPEEERSGLLEAILDQCARLDRYTAELLDVGQIEAGIAHDRLEAVNLAETVGLAVKHARLANPDVNVVRQLATGDHYVKANASMLEQAIYNLIDNAQKFGGDGGPVGVKLEIDEDRASVSVIDDGPGVLDEERERIFTRFFKGERSGSKAGMGLGLFIAKGFIEAFGGSIAVASPLAGNRGTRITVSLSLIKMDQPVMSV